MKAVLGGLVLVLVASCSSGDPARRAEPPSTPAPEATRESPSPEPELPPRKRLKAAQLALSRTTAGAYDLAVEARGKDGLFMREKGRFNVLREILEIERAVPDPDPENDEPAWLDVRIRASTDARYLQVDDWGPWEGCWMDLASGYSSLIGVDLSTIPTVPAPVALVVDARLAPRHRPALAPGGGTPSIVPAVGTAANDTVTVHTDGLTALQMFGVSAAVLLDLDPAVATAKVPARITYSARLPNVVAQVRVDGPATVEALDAVDADLDQQLTGYLRAARTGAVFRPDAIPVGSWRPPPEKLLPEGATRDQTCPANLG